MTDVLPGSYRLHFGVALVAEGATGVLDEPGVSQLRLAHLATEALRMPARVHGLDHATDYEAVALAATRSEQDLEVALAVLAVVVFVEDAVLELLEALGATGKNTFVVIHFWAFRSFLIVEILLVTLLRGIPTRSTADATAVQWS
jgi:hypothetical protein